MKTRNSIVLITCLIFLLIPITVFGSGIKIFTTLQEFEAQGGTIKSFQQSPYLDGKNLPPVKERIGSEPVVIQPYEEIGVYGGTARVFTKRPNPTEDGIGFITLEGLLKLGPDDSSFLPNVVKSYEWSKDGKTLKMVLRKGMKWSDGAPFTTEDIRFWWEDIVNNKEVTFRTSPWFKTKGGMMELGIITEQEFEFRFKDPYPFVLNSIGHYSGVTLLFPSHYLKKFHIKYNEKAGELAKESGYDHWFQLFSGKIRLYMPAVACSYDVGAPTLSPYMMTEKGADHWVFERNPYYWKVDTAGNQLPYIDRVFVQLASNVELIDAKVISGEVDFAIFNTTLENYPMYKKNEKIGHYRVNLWSLAFGAYPLIEFNQTYTNDTVLRDIFRDVRFRKAMSVAINRDEINEALFFGRAVPRQMTVSPSSKYFKPEFEKAYADFNLMEANGYLDEMGLKWDSNKQWRLRPDGKPLAFTLEYAKISGAAGQAVIEMVKKQWTKVGVNLILKQQSGELLLKRVTSNEVQVGLWNGDKITDILFPTYPMWFVAHRFEWGNSWSPLWAQWYTTNGSKGEAPTGEVLENLNRWDQMKITLDPDQQVALGQAILASQAKNLWTIGTIGLPPVPVIVRDNLRNVPEKGMSSFDNLWGQNYYPEQRFLKPPLYKAQK